MEVKKIGIAGAGVMGGEIAYIATQAGLPVVMKDVDKKFLDTGLEKVRQIYSMKVRRRRMSQEDMDKALALIETTTDYAPFSSVDFVIEAVPENIDLKRRVFAELQEACAEGAILASNTSALSISGIAQDCPKPELVVGMHFFNPVSMMRLVEVIKGKKTAPETAAAVSALAEKLGKTPVTCADTAGFIVNRLLCTAMMEAMRCAREGILTRAEIDNCLVKPEAGLPVGLFKMADQLGIDLIHKVINILFDAFGDRMAEPPEIKELFEKGALGMKTGSGFYNYGPDAENQKVVADEIDPAKRALVIERVLTAVVCEGRRMATENVATPPDIDTAMQFGALFKNPPFAYTESISKDSMEERINRFSEIFGGIFAV